MLAKHKLPVTAPLRPALNTVEPFASLISRWAEMTRREDELMAELRPLVAEIRTSGGYRRTRRRAGPAGCRSRRLPPRPAREGCRPGAVPSAPRRAPLTDIDRLKAHAAEISAELGDIIEAKKRLLPALNRARAEGSATICDAVRPEYAVIAQRIAAALTSWARHGRGISASYAISRPRGFQLQPCGKS